MPAYGVTIGRLILGTFFLSSGLVKIMGEPMAMQALMAHGFPSPAFFYWAAALVEAIGGAACIFGVFGGWPPLMLALFTLATAFFIHDFWVDAGGSMERMNNLMNFEKNLAIFGGLLVLAAHGPGPYAVRFEPAEGRFHCHPAE